MSMLFDPMVKWPRIPTLSSKMEYFITDGIIFYGGGKGPFKLNGPNAIKDSTELLSELKNNEIPYIEFVKKLSQKRNSANLYYVLTKLHSNGFLADKDAQTPEKCYLDELNQNVKNYNSVDEIVTLKSKIRIKISVSNKYASEMLEQLLLSENFILTEGDNYDWRVLEINAETSLADIDESKKNLIFSSIEDGLILGPIVSKDAVKSSELNYFKKQKFNRMISEESIYNIFLTTMKMTLKLKDFNLDRGLVVYKDFDAEYLDMIDIIGKENLDTIEKFEITSAFSSPIYQNKANHLAHYREGNIKLGEKEFVSDFWRETKFHTPKGLESVFTNLGGFKKDRSRKKMSPTGGNINSNMLFYINLSEKELDGLGIYYYEGIRNKMYQIDDNLMRLADAIDLNEAASGYLLLASNVDYIETKYHDFGFKIANLNTGVQLATLLSIKQSEEIKAIKFIENYDEASIQNAIGASMSKIIFNAVVEVTK
ncbi:hypothetical protein IGI37_000253 [Enterococcus sp. AZ194]|uniref:hypothetical protein n=1 Tax=Enterococcus sp. AZ194 TaxID=2774629 RepID=UPI003F29507C